MTAILDAQERGKGAAGLQKLEAERTERRGLAETERRKMERRITITAGRSCSSRPALIEVAGWAAGLLGVQSIEL